MPGPSPAPDPDVRASFRALMRSCRRQQPLLAAWLAAADLAERRRRPPPPPLASLVTPRSHGTVGITQAQVAWLLGYTETSVRGWESGRQPIPLGMLDDLAAVLGMTSHQRSRLWQLSRHRLPDPTPAPTPPAPAWVRHVHRRSVPCYIVDSAWRLITANEHFYEVFSWADREQPTPYLGDIVLLPQAEEVLLDWASAWAGPLMAQLWTAYQVHPDYVREAIMRIAGSPDPRLRALWDAREAYPDTHPDTSVRPLRHPRRGDGWVQLLCSVPWVTREGGQQILYWEEVDGPDA